MIDILSALVPVFALILVGFGIKRFGVVDDAFWAPAERLTYFVFFPALLVHTTASADFDSLPVVSMAAVMVVGSCLNPVLLIAVRKALKLEGPTFTSVVQGSIRPNTYIGIAAAFALAGEPGLALVAVCIVVNVPLVNLISVLALVRYGGSEKRPGLWGTISPVVRNPLILACLAGGGLNFAAIDLPPIIAPMLEILGRASLPIVLLAVGAGLDVRAVRVGLKAVGIASVMKLAVLPVIVFGLCRLFGIDGDAALVCTMFATLPVSVSSYVLARQMGGDGPVMAGIVTATTLIAMASMPALLWWVI